MNRFDGMSWHDLREAERLLTGYADAEPCDEARAVLLDLVAELKSAIAAPRSARERAASRWTGPTSSASSASLATAADGAAADARSASAALGLSDR